MPGKFCNQKDYPLPTHEDGQQYLKAPFKITQILDSQQQWMGEKVTWT